MITSPSTVLFVSIIINMSYIITCSNLSYEEEMIAEKIETLRSEENRLLNELRDRLNIEETNQEDEFDITKLFRSRARRTTQQKVRACGSKLGALVTNTCPNGCTVQSEWLETGISKACCERMCNKAEIMAGCCPDAR
ncbi:unnamed protein product [Caenorhabditis angaria]|uniref:Uncharacterized protein n=1 Tax=Caenorhabditis angaria TaxID=860376 RepID=A0A9P1IAP1_9PELO|nr:unnamed protein product [Caenorhabditis angaria]